MDFINEMSRIFQFEINNNVIETFNTIKDKHRNVITAQLVQQFNGNVNEAQSVSSINYLLYLIISTLTKNNHHLENDVIDNHRNTTINGEVNRLVENGHMTHLTQGQIKSIILCVNEIGNDNNSYTDILCSILDVLTDEQYLFILYIDDVQGNSLIKNLYKNASIAYDIKDIYANDYYTLHYNFEIGNDEKDAEISHLENVYDNNDMSTYYHFTINKLFNSDCGIIALDSELGMTYKQLLWCIYYMTNTQLNLTEKFHKFCNVLHLEQLTYVGV